MLAGAAAGGQLATRYVLSNYSDKLPFVRNADGTINQYGVAAYQVGIPVLAAIIIKKWNPTVAKGLILGGMISGVNVILNQVMAMSSAPAVTTTAGAKAYIEPMGANPPSYDAVNAFSGVYDPQPAFSGDAWGR